ncbi:MAG: S8 family serine peptidase [bacterium]|nr:S8 family serine peptidase [bacterium]
MKLLSRLCPVIALVLLTVGARAAEFSPSLDYLLSQAATGEHLSAIIILESPVDIQTLDMQLHVRKASLAERHREVLSALKYNADQTQPAFRAELEAAQSAGTVKGFTAYWIENLFVVSATSDFLLSLRARGDIKYVTQNFTPETIEPIRTDGTRPERNPLDAEFTTPGQDAIRATEVNRTLGITGQGVLVANCDTGVDGAHPALASRWRGNFAPAAECWRDAVGFGDATPQDYYGHGTHVMGTICGREFEADGDTNTVGSAPDALWIASNSINQGVGLDFDNDIIADYQWFADPDGNAATLDDVPDVIQNSWGVATFLGYDQCFDLWNTVITNCEAAGPVVTWSAGNEDVSGLRSPAIYSLNAYQIFSVGAVDATNFSWPYPLAWFSSQGPTPCAPSLPDDVKPEVSAPGVSVYSSVPGGGYDGSYSGTSMAGPHVAGAVALMRQACPDCDHMTIKDALMNTAIDLGTPGQDNQFGHGFIDAYEAVLAVSNLGDICGIVTNTSALPVAGANISITTGPNHTATDATGNYCLPLNAGAYTVIVSAFGYISQTFTDVIVSDGVTTPLHVVLSPAPSGVVSGTVFSCNGGPSVGATVTALNTPVAPVTTDAAGFYSLLLPQGTYDMSASGTGCLPQTLNGVVVAAATTQDFTLVSDPRFACSGPDAWGYTQCENVDDGGVPFDWQAITPTEGGPGISVGLLCGDCAAGPFTLPFPVRLYGHTYEDFHVTTKGYITFGEQRFDYSNTCFPDDLMPAGIYCFWDDLTGENPEADIATYYDAANHWFVISWHDVGHYGEWTTLESFQIIVYDQVFYPTLTGDNSVLFQYLTVNDGSSITVGIKERSGINASMYVCDTALDPAAFGVENGRTVLISTGLGCTLGDPVASVTPAELEGNAPLGGTDSDAVLLCNTGPCPLFWSVSWNQISPALATATHHEPRVISATREQTDYLMAMRRGLRTAYAPPSQRGRSPLDAQGGPDAFGYHWIDSDEPGGPEFDWTDLNSIGTNTGMTDDFQIVNLPLPWPITFYGVTYTSINVSTKGNAHFGPENFGYENQPLPDPFGPLAMLAPFWADLYLPASGQIFYYDDTDNARFIIEWDDIDHYPGTGDRYNFQIVIYQSGRIVFQYDELDLGGSGLEIATVGIQDETGSVGLNVVHNAPYLHSDMAIEFTATADWLLIAPPAEGLLEPGDCTTIDFTYEAGGLPAGVYTGNVTLASNDPANTTLDIPVTFTVGTYPAPQGLTITFLPGPNQLRFEWQSVGAPLYQLWSAASSDGPYATLVGSTSATSLNIPYDGSATAYYIVTANGGALLGAAELPLQVKSH